MGRQGRWGSKNEQNGFNRGPWSVEMEGAQDLKMEILG